MSDNPSEAELLATTLAILAAEPGEQAAQLRAYEAQCLERGPSSHQPPFVDVAEHVWSSMNRLLDAEELPEPIARDCAELQSVLDGLLATRGIIFLEPEEHWLGEDWEELRRVARPCCQHFQVTSPNLPLWELLCFISD